MVGPRRGGVDDGRAGGLVGVGLGLAVLLMVPAIPAAAEVVSTVSVEAFNSVILGDAPTVEESPAAAGSARAELDLQASGNRDVRSRFQLRTTLFEDENGRATSTVEVPRAEIRWRMTAGEDYLMRFTVGRSRLTWGDGALYNAGDVINGARPQQVDLTADDLRDETQWLAAAYLPLGRFSFVEPVLLVPMLRETAGGGRVAPAATDVGAGGRIHGQIGPLKTEAGYLYRGAESLHQPYLSVQGNLGVDWYAGLRWEGATAGDMSGDVAASGGMLYNGSGDRIGSWSARLETLWSDADDSLRVYPALTWSPSQLLSTFVRVQVLLLNSGRWSTVDDPASDGAIGVTWTPITGLSVSLYGTGSTDPDLGTITTAVRYTF